MNNVAKAYNDGRYARVREQPITDNPFNPETEQFGYNEWLRGWQDGETLYQDIIRYGAD